MHTIVIKYVQLFCIALLFDNVSCDNLSLEAARDDMMLNREVSCTAACLERVKNAVLTDCYYKQCKMSNQTIIRTESNSNETIRLLCREEDSLTIAVHSDDITNESDKIEHDYRKSVFLFKIQENNGESPLRTVYIADSPIVKIENLQRNTSYNVTASIFMGNHAYRHLKHMSSFKTLDIAEYVPKKISKDTIELNFAQNAKGSLDTTVKWKPAADMICGYVIHLFATGEDTYSQKSDPIYEKLQPAEVYHLNTDRLKFKSDYKLEIHGTNAKNEMFEGEKCVLNFTTPTCWDIYEYNFQKCRPLPLININSTYQLIESEFFRINVTWDMPKYNPDYYNVSLNLNSKGDVVVQNVTGAETHAYFPEVYISDIAYDVTIVAFTQGGHTANPTVSFNLDVVHSNFFVRYKRALTILGVLSPFVVLLGISLAYVVVQSRRNRLRHKKEIFSKEMYLQKLIQAHNKDEMEIDPANVELYELLGEGAFGIVRKGILKPTHKPIAVKMLKENAGIEDIKGFLSEITLMKSVGHHENIVGIVGHSTKLINNMMLLTEYCSEGNLLDYLRKFRDTFLPELLYSTTHTDVLTFSTFEKSPEDIFNFDTKLVDKLALQDKSISLSAIGQNDPKNMLERNEQKVIYKEPAVQNVIFNRLYDEQALEPSDEKQLSRNITYENDATVAKNDDNCKCRQYDELKHLCKCSTAIKYHKCLVETKCKLTIDPDVLLFAENQGYDILLPKDKCIHKKSYNKGMDETKSVQIDHCKLDGKGSYLTGKDLLLFAKQIATGMAFLANNKIVHRDLAARNVLVCTDKTVKIADFGLSRDIYVDNIYMKSSAGRLPIKWLALESMTDQKYTSQSDVWSFGILLYEIVTMGCTPYPTVPVDCLVNYLKAGNRMSKPNNCSPEFYELMFSCWHCEANERPTFTDILRKIDWFIHQSERIGPIRIDKLDKTAWTNEPIKVENICSSTSYLKPL